MKLENSQKRISELLSRFVAQIEHETSMGKTDLNKTAETILIPLLNEVYGWSLKNINYAEENNNYPGIDLADEVARISIQVTATPTPEKVKHTLEQFTKHSQYLKYDRLIIYVLTNKKVSYPEKTIQKIIQNRFNFDLRKDIWDRRNILKEVSNFQIDKTLRVQEILEANFGEDKSPSASLLRELEQKTDWQQICWGMLPIELDTNLLISGDGVTLGIEDIVPLDLVERKKCPQSPRDPLPENSRHALEDQEIPLPYNQFFSHVLTGCRSLNQQGKGVAIIGEPGAGKTTLLCAIADWIIEQGDLPIFIALQDLEEVPLKTFLLKHWLKDALRKREAPEPLQDGLVEQCNAGRVWLLLDGVDEMAQSDRFLSTLAKAFKGWLADARVVLTCRVNVWEANRNDLRPKFEVYRSRGFNDEDQLIFIQNFFAKANEPETGIKLIQELGNAPLRLKDLIKAPLWLTLLCRIWKRRQEGLPETRTELYRQFTETFYDWKDKPHVPKEKRPLLERALGELAKKAIDREQFRFRLRETFIRQELDKFDSSLFGIACELGWINKLGSVEDPHESVYAFLHPTFQEYFAALAIEDWDDFLPRRHVDKPIENFKGECKYRIFESQWKEVILLWLGKMDERLGEQKNQFMKKLTEFEDGCESYYNRQAYLLATAGLREFKECLFADSIIIDTIKLCFGFSEENEQAWRRFSEPISWLAQVALLETDHSKASDFIAQEIIPLPPNSLCLTDDRVNKAAEILGLIGHDNLKSINALINLIASENTHSVLVRSKAAESLVKIVNKTKDFVVRKLTTLLSEVEDKSIQIMTAKTLEDIDPGNSAAKTLLTELVQPNQNEEIRLQSAWTLLEFDKNNSVAISTLDELAQSDNQGIALSANSFLRERESPTTNRHDEYSSEEIYIAQEYWNKSNSLIELLNYNAPRLARQEAIRLILEKVKLDYLNAINALVEVIYSHPDQAAIPLIIEILGKVAIGDENVVRCLIHLIRNKSPLYSATIRTLSRILQGKLFSIVVSDLKDYLKNEEDNDIMRYQEINRVVWLCARRMSYSDFYQAWHSSTTNDAELSIHTER